VREGIKREAVYGDVNWSREQRLFVEGNPVDVMVIGHGLLNYPTPPHQPVPLYWWNSNRSIAVTTKSGFGYVT
jgi:hypothetical protein